MIDWTETHIITHNIIFGMKKGIDMGSQTSLKTSEKGGCNPPQPSPWIRHCFSKYAWANVYRGIN